MFYKLQATSFQRCWNVIIKLTIVLFFLWHITAVGVYAIPQESQNPPSAWLKRNILPNVAPYILLTGQWQQWNLFAPDPLRRVTYYRIEQWDGWIWRSIAELKPGIVPWWRHAAQFKVFERLLEEGNTWKIPLRQRYVSFFCRDFSIPSGTPLRLVYLSYVIPKDPHIRSFTWWRSFTPQWSFTPDVTIGC